VGSRILKGEIGMGAAIYQVDEVAKQRFACYVVCYGVKAVRAGLPDGFPYFWGSQRGKKEGELKACGRPSPP
jgi:hypothetical protein